MVEFVAQQNPFIFTPSPLLEKVLTNNLGFCCPQEYFYSVIVNVQRNRKPTSCEIIWLLRFYTIKINLCFGWADVVCPDLTLVFALVSICEPTLLKFGMAVNKIKA